MNVFIDCVNEKPDYCREIGPNRIFDGFFTRYMNEYENDVKLIISNTYESVIGITYDYYYECRANVSLFCSNT